MYFLATVSGFRVFLFRIAPTGSVRWQVILSLHRPARHLSTPEVEMPHTLIRPACAPCPVCTCDQRLHAAVSFNLGKPALVRGAVLSALIGPFCIPHSRPHAHPLPNGLGP